jgi:hypothetical protein
MFDTETAPKTKEYEVGYKKPPKIQGRWKKGESGNPRGRPKKDLDLAKEAQKHAMKAIKALAEIVEDQTAPPPSRISAASELLDRGFGRAPQSIDLKHTLSLSDEFEQFIRRLNGSEPPVAALVDDREDAIDAEYEDVDGDA